MTWACSKNPQLKQHRSEPEVVSSCIGTLLCSVSDEEPCVEDWLEIVCQEVYMRGKQDKSEFLGGTANRAGISLAAWGRINLSWRSGSEHMWKAEAHQDRVCWARCSSYGVPFVFWQVRDARHHSWPA